jgi:hypothetical protein
MTYQDLFIDFYQNVKDSTWPEYDDLIKLDPIPKNILYVIVTTFQVPDEADPAEKNRIICESLKIKEIPEEISTKEKGKEYFQRLLDRERFEKFYNGLKTDSWPEVKDFLEKESKSFDILEDIFANWNMPGNNYIIDQLKKTDSYIPLKNAEINMHNYFFWSTVDFYRQKPEILDLLDHTYSKPKYFEILLGRRKYHRDLIYNNIDHEKNIVTYMSEDESLNLAQDQNFVWPSDVLDPENIDITNTASIVKVDGIIVSLSQIIPVSVYNQTAYSLVCESQHENNFSFFTEKIIKPILGRRIFLACSGRYFLKNLRSLGFQTFDSVIDESYDNEWNLEKRVEMLLQQVEYLYTVDQSEIYQQVHTVLEHNFNLIMNNDWQRDMIKSIANEIKIYV